MCSHTGDSSPSRSLRRFREIWNLGPRAHGLTLRLKEPALAEEYGIQSIPLIALFRNGRLERVSQGAKPRPQIEGDLGMLVIP